MTNNHSSFYFATCFTFTFTNGNDSVPATVVFTNTSKNAVTYRWSFGDNTPITTQTSPTHTFTKDSSYNIKLEATNSAGVTKSITKTVIIKSIITKKIRLFLMRSMKSNKN